MQQKEFVSEQPVYQQNRFSTGAGYASQTQRFFNYLIDSLIFYGVMYGTTTILLIVFYLTVGGPGESSFQIVLILVSYIFYILFYTFCEGASRGKSVGKLITRTKVVREDESEITWKDAFTRSLCRIVPFEPFSAFGGFPWHDQWSHTKVICINK
ncbi:MAG TPA: RDD family protein [Chitinophagaceae bacterium]|jgi:uncharacterized RDD family membrane protein YckC